MLRHPSRHYIHYLLSKRSYDIATLVRMLGDQYLPVPQTDEHLKPFVADLKAIRDGIAPPHDFDPYARPLNLATQHYLDRWGIRGMWTADPYVCLAVDYLMEPQIRRMLEVLLLGPFTISSVARLVRRRFQLDIEAMNPRVVDAYAHYFWSFEAMSIPDWMAFVPAFIHGDTTDYRTALMSPRTVSGMTTTLAVADRGGDELNAAARYSATRDLGFRMFMEHALLQKPSMGRTQGALLALQIMTASEFELAKHRGGSAELLEELRKIDTVYDATPMKSVQDLPVIRPAALPRAVEADPTTEKDKEHG